MLLAIDVGNTHVVIGLYQGDELLGSWRLTTNAEKTVDEYALELLALIRTSEIDAKEVTQVIISCVVPPLTRVFTKVGQKYFKKKPLIVGPGVKTGLQIACDDPRSVGADRIVNAVAAIELFGAPSIVVDFGTATTFDVIKSPGTYEGGVIAPGVLISANALSERAAQLPNIQISRPDFLIGKNTKDSMLSGIYFGYLGLIEGVITRLLPEFDTPPHVIATGGFANVFTKECKLIAHVVPDLTLQGLKIIAYKNI